MPSISPVPDILPRPGSPKPPPSFDKLRGGYYTPGRVAEWLCKWAIRNKNNFVLEPSCGSGSIAVAIAKRLIQLGASPLDILRRVTALELIEAEGRIARQALSELISLDCSDSVEIGDFFVWNKRLPPDKTFDCVVGNPPFIRYQNVKEPTRSLSMDLLQRVGLKPNKLTNLWVSFVVGATERLNAGGRLALVVPAELLQVSYAAQLRRYLTENFGRIEIVGCNELFFDGAEQEVVLLLAEDRKAGSKGTCYVDLVNFDNVEQIVARSPLRLVEEREFKDVRHDSEKWLKYFLSAEEIGLLRALRESKAFAPLKAHAEVDVGVVTGNNDFFVLSADRIAEHRLQKDVSPVVGRASQLRGSIFSPNDYKKAVAAEERAFLFSSASPIGKLLNGAQKYIAQGQRLGVNKGYKCSIRKNWYEVPSVWRPDGFMFRQIHDFPRLIINRTRATSTDTIHRVTLKTDPEKFLPNFYTHLTAASAEVEGRSYGGGVLELEPTEAERLLVPAKIHKGLCASEIDQRLRAGGLESVLEHNDRKILIDGIGISARDCAMLKAIWEKMRARRSSRRKSKTG